MKNSYLIRNLGPNLLRDYSLRPHAGLLGTTFHSLALWVALLGLLSWIGFGVAHAQSSGSDPMVMKIYPDGTKVVLRWSEVGKSVDNGEKFGGAPRIVAYDPAKDGIVPIGQPSQKPQTAATNSAVPSSSSVVSPEQPAKMDYTHANPDDWNKNQSPTGFYIGPEMGVAINSNLNFKTVNGYSGDDLVGDYELTGSATSSLSVNPGIRFNFNMGYRPVDWFGQNLGVASATVSGGTSPYIYEWNDFLEQTTSTADSLYAGAYKVTVYDYHNCKDTGWVTIDQPPILELNTATVTDTCEKGLGIARVTVQGGTPFYTYFWIPDSINQSIATNIPAGIHYVVVTDANNCADTAQAVVQNILAPSADFEFTPDENGILYPQVVFGNLSENASRYLWNFGDGSGVS